MFTRAEMKGEKWIFRIFTIFLIFPCAESRCVNLNLSESTSLQRRMWCVVGGWNGILTISYPLWNHFMIVEPLRRMKSHKNLFCQRENFLLFSLAFVCVFHRWLGGKGKSQPQLACLFELSALFICKILYSQFMTAREWDMPRLCWELQLCTCSFDSQEKLDLILRTWFKILRITLGSPSSCHAICWFWEICKLYA